MARYWCLKNKKKCIDCDQCIKICKFYSSPKVEEYTVEGLVKEIEKLRIFIQGVTVSGGEATLNIKFITEFFKEVKKMNLSTFVDTNGSIDLSLDKYTEFLEVSDKFMLDIKAWNESEHRELTNADNKIVLKNLEFLLKKNKMFEVRTVVNSMINAKETVLNVAKVLKDYKNVRYKIIAYRPFGVKEELKDKLLPLPKNEELEELKKIVEKTGDIEVILL